jgi:hypothetical protein
MVPRARSEAERKNRSQAVVFRSFAIINAANLTYVVIWAVASGLPETFFMPALLIPALLHTGSAPWPTRPKAEVAHSDRRRPTAPLHH